MRTNSFKVVKAGGIPLIAQLCNKFRIEDKINELVKWKSSNSKVSPGLMIESLITCIICGRKAFWKLDEFWKEQDVENLFPDLTYEQFNDDAYGRALDKLSEIPMKYLINEIGLNLLQTGKFELSAIHFDTTSKSLQGAYDLEF